MARRSLAEQERRNIFDYGVTLILPTTKFEAVEKKPNFVPLSVDGMVPENVCPELVMVAVVPLKLTVKGAVGVLVQI